MPNARTERSPKPAALPPRDPRHLRAAYHHLGCTLRDLESDLRWGLDGSARIPAAWADIARGPVVPFKTAVTIRLDEDVARFFRAMGRGHLTRMNAVLRAFMLARLAGVVPGPEDVAYAPTPDEVREADRRTFVAAALARAEAQEAAHAALSDKEKRKLRLEELRHLRDLRQGR